MLVITLIILLVLLIYDLHLFLLLKGENKKSASQEDEVFKHLRKTYFRIFSTHYSCIDKTFAYTAAGNIVQLYLVYHGSRAKNSDPTFSSEANNLRPEK